MNTNIRLNLQLSNSEDRAEYVNFKVVPVLVELFLVYFIFQSPQELSGSRFASLHADPGGLFKMRIRNTAFHHQYIGVAALETDNKIKCSQSDA